MLNLQKIKTIQEVTCFSAGSLPLKYLGVPIHKTRLPSSAFESVLEKAYAKLESWKTYLLSFGGKMILVKSVINSGLLHLLALCRLPSTCIHALQCRLISLIWDSTKERKHRWIGANHIFKPLDGGGLGIEKISTAMKGLHTKPCWKYITSNSLWDCFMRDKYGAPAVVIQHDRNNKCSHVWSIIYPRIKDLLDNMGSCINPFSGETEKYWKSSQFGKVEVKKWKQINHYSQFSNLKLVWHKNISANLSCFYWKIWNDGLSTDLNARNVGIVLASKCRCCKASKEESATHLFLESDLAVTIWRYYAIPFNITWQSKDIRGFLSSWVHGANLNSLYAYTRVMVLLVGLLAIWKHRNAIMHDEEQLNPGSVLEFVKKYV